MTSLEIEMLPAPDLRVASEWQLLSTYAAYRAWAQENAPWVFDWAPSSTAQGVACTYSLVANGDTYRESVVLCDPDGSEGHRQVWVLLVTDEMSPVTALRMALRAFNDLREETGEGMPSQIDIV